MKIKFHTVWDLLFITFTTVAIILTEHIYIVIFVQIHIPIYPSITYLVREQYIVVHKERVYSFWSTRRDTQLSHQKRAFTTRR